MNTKITLAIPSFNGGGIDPKTFQCLLEMVAQSKYDIHIVVAEEGYTIAENRNYIVYQAINNKSDYLLMIDADMTFLPDTLDKLLSNDKDICGVAYHSRGSTDIVKIVPDIMSIVETNKGKYINLEEEKDPKYKKTFECYATGTGIILIKVNIFRKIMTPWFEFTWHSNGKCKEGEDWNFCFKAKDEGYKIYCDPTIKVGHLGEKIL